MNGLWTATFSGVPNLQPGGGVVVFEDDRVLGGDAGYYYLGTVEASEHEIRSRVRIVPFIPSAPSVFGTIGKEFTLVLTGKRFGDTVEGSGYPIELPSARFIFRLTKVA